MKNFLLFALLLFLGLSLKVHATPQIPDVLIYEGKEYPVQTDFLHDYFKRFPERNPKDDSLGCSANWRGYQATFEVLEGGIYLKDVAINVCMGPPTSQLKKVVPGGERLFVDWVSGLIHSGYGENHEDLYGLASLDAYEKYAFFEVEKGKILEARHFDNKNYRAFKKNQFKAFQRTPEYETSVKKMLTDYPKMKREDVDANIELWIFFSTKTFLVADGRTNRSGAPRKKK